MKCPLMLALPLSLATLGHAGLVFDADVVQETAAATQTTHESKFRFKVQGDRPITIKEVQTTCGCLSATADKKTYAPGETGTVSAVISLGAFEGEITKSVYVHSDDPAASKLQLQMKITIPKLMEITPDVTTWQVGDPPVTRTVTIKVLYDKPIEVTRVTTERKKFALELKEITKGREYQIKITPETTAEPTLGALRISTTCDVPRYKNRLAFFNIVRPRSSPAAPVRVPAATPPAAAVTPPAAAAATPPVTAVTPPTPAEAGPPVTRQRTLLPPPVLAK